MGRKRDKTDKKTYNSQAGLVVSKREHAHKLQAHGSTERKDTTGRGIEANLIQEE